jgi:hypothetical protein
MEMRLDAHNRHTRATKGDFRGWLQGFTAESTLAIWY